MSNNGGNYGQNPQGGWDNTQNSPWTQPGNQPSADPWANQGQNTGGWGQQPPSGPTSAPQYPSSPGSSSPASAGWNTTGTWNNTGYQTGPQGPQTGYQTGYQTGPGQAPYQPSNQPPKKKSNLTPLIAGGVGLALIAAVATGLVLSRDRGSSGQDTTGQTTGATTGAPTPSPTPTVKAPGEGTYDTAIDYLKANKFTCTEEGTSGIQSTICTHFGAAPYMIAYVGATTSGGLGRVALEVQEDAQATIAKQVSDELIEQFATTDQAATIKSRIAAGAAPGYTSDDKLGDVRYRGNKRGSVVMWIEDWVPQDVKPRYFEVQPADRDKVLTANGYKCTARGTLNSCTKSANNVDYLITFIEAPEGNGLARLSVRAVSKEAGVGRPAFQAEAKKVLPELNKETGTAVLTWMGKQDERTGGLEFVNGQIVDYYPRSTVQGNEAGSVYIWASCWSGTREYC
ncbi:hypothetical protein ACQCX5_09300 [Propionibacteriaceae bacterium G57]|uniref:hypothetical protein n=1 Tax=Aestuariimicrobium sp. G57 TaxID=3418485 RepID=UPI003DA72746